MNENYEEKLNLLSELVSFAQVDGKLHEKEVQFLQLVACELRIKHNDFKDLFQADLKGRLIANNMERIMQFYRLALLMYSDGFKHPKENLIIHEIGLKMALNPNAIERILKAMDSSPTKTVDANFLINVFNEQLN